MKKIIFTATLFTLSLVTFAQAPTISVQANGLYSNLSFDGYEKFDGFGYSFGIAGDFPLSEKMSIRPEINIQQRRLKSSYEESYSSAEYVYEELYNYKINMSYLDIPILIQYKPTKHIGFYAGPQFGTSLGTKTTVEYSASEVDKSTGEKYSETGSYSDGDDDWSMQEVSIALGTNYSLENGLSFEFRLQRSIAAAEDFDFSLDDVHWTQLQLGCRYTFPHK